MKLLLAAASQFCDRTQRTASEPSYCLDDSTTKATANNPLLKPSVAVPPQVNHHRCR